MAIATGTAIALAGAAAAGASAAGAAYSANKNSQAAQAGSDAAVKAAQIQADAAQKAADTASEANKAAAEAQLRAAQEALAFQKQVYAQRQAQVAPYISMGQGALGDLAAGLGVHGVPQPPPAIPAVSGGTTSWSDTSAPPPVASPQTTTIPTSLSGFAGAISMQPTPAMPTIGTQRTINGTPAVWDGKGWKATGATMTPPRTGSATAPQPSVGA